jgi:hypothetical protein
MKKGGSAIAGPLFLLFAGVLVKCGGWLWCFCGEVVVGCVVNVVS